MDSITKKAMTTEDQKLADYIWNDVLQKSVKPFLWHFDYGTVRTIHHGTSFRVVADYVTGLVKIRVREDGNFSVGIIPDGFPNELTYEGLTCENLVYTIDRVLTKGIFIDNTESRGYAHVA